MRGFDYLAEQILPYIFDRAEIFASETDIDVRPSDIVASVKAFKDYCLECIEEERSMIVVSAIDAYEGNIGD